MDNIVLINVLKTVPEKKLLIVDLSWQLIGDTGQIDYRKVIDRQKEVNLALAEAHAYANATTKAIHALFRIGDKPVKTNNRSRIEMVEEPDEAEFEQEEEEE
jgi:hypothetical protein